MKQFTSVIVGSGSVLPTHIKKNSAFWENTFYTKENVPQVKTSETITAKFEEITGIVERRCAPEGTRTSDLGAQAAQLAIQDAGVDPETIDYIIIAHNFGDVSLDGTKNDLLPNLAARVKQKLGIKNSRCVAYDILFGCPSWVEAFIQANYFLRSGDVKRILVIGSDTVSRVTDPHDIDGMLFADGAGAVVLEAREVDENDKKGVLAHLTVSDCNSEADFLTMSDSLNPELDGLFIRMYGKGVFRYAVEKVPAAIHECLAKAGKTLHDVDKFIIHQANMKMNKIIMKRTYEVIGEKTYPEDVMPLIIDKTGNSSAATVPTLWDLIMKGQLENQEIKSGDLVVFASVGAGMHANCIVYRHA
jgi:3-oxoacyl-[acyl-carrier-protein] synthase III